LRLEWKWGIGIGFRIEDLRRCGRIEAKIGLWIFYGAKCGRIKVWKGGMSVGGEGWKVTRKVGVTGRVPDCAT